MKYIKTIGQTKEMDWQLGVSKSIHWSIILLTLMLNNKSIAQTDKAIQPEPGQNTKIALADILGDWYPINAQTPKISFQKTGNTLVEIDGIKHGVGNYSFVITQDSMAVNGMAINWPPYDCKLLLKENNVLEIVFWQFHTAGTTSILYTRK